MPAGRRGEAPGWADLAVQYVDYTLWQQFAAGRFRPMPAAASAAELGFWEDAPWPVCRSNCSCPLTGPIRWSRGLPGRHSSRWTGRPELQQRVAQVGGREHNATSFMVMQTALAMLLSKVSANNDVAVVVSRSPDALDAALDELVGFFVNTLVLRVDLTGNPTCRRCCWPRCADRSLSAYEHQDVPFEVLVERLKPTRSIGAAPTGAGSAGLAELCAGRPATPLGCRWVICGWHRCRSIPRQRAWTSTFALAERWTEAGEARRYRWGGRISAPTYSTPPAMRGAWLSGCERVLVEMTADPARRMSSLDVLDAAGEHARLDEVGNRQVLS